MPADLLEEFLLIIKELELDYEVRKRMFDMLLPTLHDYDTPIEIVEGLDSAYDTALTEYFEGA